VHRGLIYRKSIEYSLVDHCNLSCYACDHSSPVLPPALAGLDTFEADLRALEGVLSVKRLYLIGGEPLLHPRLLEFLGIARRSPAAECVTVVTNGVRLHTMPEDFWHSLGGLDLTLYPGVTLRMSLDDIATKARCHGVELRVRERPEFRHTLLNTRLESPALVQQIFDACRIAHDYSCHSIHEGRYYKCSVAPHLPKRMRQNAGAVDGWESDGVRLHDNPHLRRDLERYLQDDRPLATRLLSRYERQDSRTSSDELTGEARLATRALPGSMDVD
jgi:MoaA/NifB/PqqE/SkfB family radical SAM enzyme